MSDETIKARLDHVSEKLDKLVELNEHQSAKLASHDVMLAKVSTTLEINTEALKEHKLNVAQNSSHIQSVETRVDQASDKFNNDYNSIRQDIKPLLVREGAKMYIKSTVVTTGAVAGAIFTVLKLIGTI